MDENNQLVLLYRVVPGLAEHSFGLNIANIVGMPSTVIAVSCKKNLYFLRFIVILRVILVCLWLISLGSR